MANDDPRIFQFDDYTLKTNSFEGMSWKEQCQQIIDKLPEKVYVSFDIDGLSPDNCPSTGTPVPGGLSFHEAVYLIDAISRSGRTIIGFDLNEVVPSKNNQWDANVGARMLYKLCNITLK
jgi:agmatinase